MNVIFDLVVKFLQSLRGAGFGSDLEELNADLPRRSVELVEFFRSVDDDALRVVGGDAVGDDDDVERFDGLDVVTLAVKLREVRLQDLAEFGARGGAAARSDGVEDLLHLLRPRDVLVVDVVHVVQEVDVDAVFVEGGADWCYGR